MTQRQAENIAIFRCDMGENSLFVTFDKLLGTIDFCGDNVWIGALQQNQNMKKHLEDMLLKARNNMTRDQKLILSKEVPRHFAIPNTKEWKPIVKIWMTLGKPSGKKSGLVMEFFRKGGGS